MEFLQIQIPTDRTSGTRTRATQMLTYKFVEICSTPLTTALRRLPNIAIEVILAYPFCRYIKIQKHSEAPRTGPPHRTPLYRQSNSNTFHELKCKSFRYTSSFFPDAITSWNNVFTEFVDIPSFNVLKIYVLSLIRSKKKRIFGIHDPLGLRYLFQLRVGLSSLRCHRKRHKFIDTPSDKCLCNQGIEDTNHFLFLCPVFGTRRATLAINIIAILQKYNLLHSGN